jgi:chromosome segregation ATPase
MNDQQFVNTYIRILNDTISEAISKNLVLQAQLEVSKQASNYTADLESKLKELSGLSSDNNALQTQLNNLKAQLDQSNSQLNNKNGHVETFKRELVDARNIIKNVTIEHQTKIAALNAEHNTKVDALNVEIKSLKTEIEELKARKKKKETKLALNTVESVLEAENNGLISVSDTF